MRRPSLFATALVACAGLLAGCAASESGRTFSAPGPAGGKFDSYVSSAATEYGFTATARFKSPLNLAELSAEEVERTLAEQADRRLRVVADAIHAHLKARAKELNDEIPKELPPELAAQIEDEDEETKRKVLENWRTQQEVTTFLRVAGKHYATIRPAEEGYHLFDLEVEAVLSNRLVTALFAGGENPFELEIPAASGGSDREPIRITATPTPSTDAFPRYDKLFEDHVLDVAIHVGGDYNDEEVEVCCPDPAGGEEQCRKEKCKSACEETPNVCNTPPEGCTVTYRGGRVDREAARRLVETLKADGFAHEAETYKDLRLDSPPFVKTYDLGGFPLEVRIKIVYPEIVPCGEESKLVDAMIESLATKEIITYAGHAGPGAGFVVDYQPRVDLDDSRWKDLQLPDFYQIVMMYGCKTYSTYADALYANPAKNDANLDVVTTVNTMWTNMGLPGTLTVLFNMLLRDRDGRHVPVSWVNLLAWLNGQDQNAHTHYGIHGVDADPKVSPFVDLASQCRTCEDHTDCPGFGNFCFDFDSGTKGCSAVCAADAGCGEGFACQAVPGLEDTVIPRFCMPLSGTCP